MTDTIPRQPIFSANRRMPFFGLVDRIFNRSPRSNAANESNFRAFDRLDTLLANAHRALSDPEARDAAVFEEIVDGLAEVRTHAGAQGWIAAVNRVRRHPLLALMHQEDLMRRAFHAPTGTAGDIVRLAAMDDPTVAPRPPGALTELGVRLREWLVAGTLMQSLVNRAAILAHAIDAAARAVPAGAEVLALQCGVLSEARLSHAVGAGKLGRLVALDHDFRATEAVEHAFGRAQINAIHTPTYALLNGAASALGRFDLIYSAALFERLDTRAAAQALAATYAMLKPGGRILIANLAPTLPEAGLLEAVMNWWPIYRGAEALTDLGGSIARAGGATTRLTLEPTDNIFFLELTRPA